MEEMVNIPCEIGISPCQEEFIAMFHQVVLW
jgi:hypothetical protein